MASTYARSFAAGEVTPELAARLELSKRQTGLTKASNFTIRPYGPAQNRAGFEYILEAGTNASPSRLHDFSFSDEQTYALEFGEGKLRFHTQGGTLLEPAKTVTAITQALNGVVTCPSHGYVTGEWVFFTISSGMVELSSRFAKIEVLTSDTFKIKHLGVRAFDYIDTTTFGAFVGGTVARVYEIATPYSAGDLFDLNFTQKEDVLSIAHPSHDVRELARTGLTNFNWIERSNPKAFGLTAIAYSPSLGRYAAVGAADGTDAYIVTSTDLATWTERANPKNFKLNAICWSPDLSLFVAVGQPDGTDAYIITSADGITWTERANPKNFALNGVCWAPELGLFCAVGAADGTDAYIVTSPDGTTWTERANPSNVTLYAVAWSGATFLACGENTVSGATRRIYTPHSTDGTTWVLAFLSFAFPLGAVYYGAGIAWNGFVFCMVGFQDGTAVFPAGSLIVTATVSTVVSFDLLTVAEGNVWTTPLTSISSDGALTVACGEPSGGDALIIRTTAAGCQSGWTEVANPKTNKLFAIATDRAGVWVAVGAADATDAYIITANATLTFTFTSPSFAPTIAAPSAAPTAVAGGPGGGTPVNVFYAATVIKTGTLEESLISATSIAVSIDLTVAGNFVTVTPNGAPSDALRYNVYKQINGLFGFIGQVAIASSIKDNNITPDLSITPPILGATLKGANLRPAAVGYAEGRRIFAGSNFEPQTVWMARSGTESNFTYSVPTRDDDAITVPIKAQKVQRIRHIVPLDDLVLLTMSGAWQVAPVANDILTPDSVWPKQRSGFGASKVQPTIAGNSVLYVGATGDRIFELTWRESSGGLSAIEISVMAPHLFEGHTIIDSAYTESSRTSWYVRSDGVLLGFTYLPEHEVLAWHQHNVTNGNFESVGSIREGKRDILYASIQRTVNGNVVRYIEAQTDREFLGLANAVFLDSAISYSGDPISAVSGAWHLQGEEVWALADGAVMGPLTVSANGDVTLDNEASVVHIGKLIVADFETLPLIVERAAAFAQGQLKNIGKVYVSVKDTSLFKIGPSFDELRAPAIRTDEPYGSPPRLFTGYVPVNISPKWSKDAPVCIRQDLPLPITIRALVMESEQSE